MTYTAQTKQPVNEQVLDTEELRTVEISFFDHEIYCGDKLIARISYNDGDFVTQPWVVMVNGEEIHRANTYAKCHTYIRTHYKRGTLPVQQPETPAATTGNEIMAQIAQECEKQGFELLDDGIYLSDFKVGEVGYTLNNSQLNSMPKSQKTCNCNDSMTNSLHNCELRIANCSGGSSEPLQRINRKSFVAL